MKLTTGPGGVEALAEEAVVAACTLADAADPSRWSEGAVEDVAAALEVLAGALAQLDPECAEILSVVPVAVATVVERAEQAAAGASESAGGRTMTVTNAALRQALAAHGLTRARVQQLGAALVGHGAPVDSDRCPPGRATCSPWRDGTTAGAGPVRGRVGQGWSGRTK
ncbi:hypothetical protein ACFY5K_34700 [Streptomyces griseofuscus]|uniref:hypothetical protein n=1 Tax=Streptomyces griseofuscus TaxID=146922 RepID=UPI0036CB9F5E